MAGTEGPGENPFAPTGQLETEPLRQYGAYAQALEPGPGADDAAALLCYLGRSPAWTA